MDGAGAPDRAGRGLAEPDVKHLALLDELGHRANRLLDRNLRVHAVLVVEVQAIGPEPLQGSVDRAAHVLGRAVCRADRGHVAGRRLIHAPRELCRDHVLVTVALDRAPDQLLVGQGPVQLRRVEEVDTELERALNRRDRLGLVGRAVEGGHPHASEPEGGDLERSELASLHFSSIVYAVAFSWSFLKKGSYQSSTVGQYATQRARARYV